MDNKLTQYILKHSKNRDKELKYDFMPSLLEIIERPSHKGGTIIIYGIFSLLIIAIIWACLSKIDVVVMAGGNIQPSGKVNVVQSNSSGVLRSIKVSEGEYVQAGDVLLELDTQIYDIDEEQLKQQKKVLSAQLDAYQKISNKAKLDINDYDRDLKSHIQAISDANNSYNNTLKNLENEKASSNLNIQIAKLQLEEYKASGTKRQQQSQELIINQYEIAVKSFDVQISDTKLQYNIQVNSKISELSLSIKDIETKLDKYTLSKEYQYITAPVSGQINSVSVNTKGASITAAQELITIIPRDVPVEMVCYVKNMDIADIKIDMDVEIKLEAYSYNKFGTVNGKVKYISPSAFIDDKMGSVYIVKIEIEDYNEKINLIPGLTGAVEIKTNKRSVMDYFLEPIKKGFGESLKEK